MTWEDLKPLLEDLLFGALEVYEGPTLIFIVITVITISMIVHGRNGRRVLDPDGGAKY